MPTRLSEIIRKHQQTLLSEWIAELKNALGRKLIKDAELEQQCSAFLKALEQGASHGEAASLDNAAWSEMKELLNNVSRSRGLAGYSPSETAMFVFSFKRPLFSRLRKDLSAAEAADEQWNATLVLDQLGLLTTETYQRTREELITRQQQDMLELSTPVVKLWDGVLALPMIGTLDSARTQVVMETLLQRIVETGSAVAILDITGVPTVDTLVAQHLLKTIAAARLMGADCIISGIRPQIAQTIVHLGVDLGTVTTKASLADAFALALQRTGQTVIRVGQARKMKEKDGEAKDRKERE
ncbi:MAG TPA: STAS domain-containing protein [Myxococcales bacterium]|nr:STAS domain-containing protein [Myxococcales bacterium]